MKEPWFTAAVDGAVKAAAEYEKDHKWLEAARIYGPLSDMLAQNLEYKAARQRCEAYIRIELLYSADSDWESTVKNIFPSMATDAFRKIEENYLTEPSFKAAAIAGVDQMLRMAHSSKLQKVFPALADKDKTDEFCDRLDVRLQQAKRADKMDAEGLVDLFERVLAINREIDLFPQTVVVHEFVHGALQPLDQFSDMLWPADILEFNKHTQGRFSGVGIQIRKPPGEPILVISPLDDTPALSQGHSAQRSDSGDQRRPDREDHDQRGRPPHHRSAGDVRHADGETRRCGKAVPGQARTPGDHHLQPSRASSARTTASGTTSSTPQQKIGYVRMTNFTEGTIDELQEIIRSLREDQKMKGLIFDLRGNPGGPLKASVDVSDLFLDRQQEDRVHQGSPGFGMVEVIDR